MRKKCVVLFLILLLLCAGCSFTADENELANERGIPQIINNLLLSIFKNPSEGYLDDLLYAIKQQDSVSFRALFSENAILSTPGFDSKLEEVFSLFDEDFLAFEYIHGVSSMRRCGQHIHTEDNIECDIKTSNGYYRLVIRICLEDTIDADNIGIIFLYITKTQGTSKTLAKTYDHWTGIIIE